MIIHKRHTWRNMAAAVLLCAGLASCSQDDIPGNPQGESLPGGEYPLMLTASVDGMRSRVAGKDAWTDDDEIGVRIGTDGATGRYKLNADGTVKEAATPVYWQNSTPADVKAWYPYASQEDVDISDQSKEFAAFDYLTAVAENRTFQNPVELKFKHLMAKVSYTLNGEGITNDELAAASVQIAGYTCATFAEGELTGELNDWITPTSDKDALLVPQDMTGKKFIKVSINGKYFYYTPATNTSGGLLEAGKHYHYTITVMPYGIKVTAAAGEWIDGGNEEIYVPQYKTDLNKAKIGDLLTASGKLIDVDDLYKISVATKKEQGVAVVFYVGQHEHDRSNYSSSGIRREKCHGYAVALYDATGNTAVDWGVEDQKIGCLREDIDNEQKQDPTLDWCGYDWTQKIITAAGGKENLNATEESYPATYYAVVAYEDGHKAPANSSGWFLPSISQILAVSQNQSLLPPAGGIRLKNAKDVFYWSSSEYWGNAYYWAWYSSGGYHMKHFDHFVRSILAF